MQVLGTSFNIFARGDQFRVECFTGKVQVTLNSGATELLLPGKGVGQDRKPELQLADVEPTTSPEWIDGNFTYENAIYAEVFREIERQFNVTIQVDEATAQKHYQGVFNRNWGLEKVLDEVCFTKGLSGQDRREKKYRSNNNKATSNFAQWTSL